MNEIISCRRVQYWSNIVSCSFRCPLGSPSLQDSKRHNFIFRFPCRCRATIGPLVVCLFVLIDNRSLSRHCGVAGVITCYIAQGSLCSCGSVRVRPVAVTKRHSDVKLLFLPCLYDTLLCCGLCAWKVTGREKCILLESLWAYFFSWND